MTIKYLEMSAEEIEQFLQAPRFAIVGTKRLNAPPQQTPVWYLYEDGKVYITMLARSAKYRNLSRDPSVSICIAAEHPDARAVIFSGLLELFDAGSATWIDEIVWKLIRRYYDNDTEADSYIKSIGKAEQEILGVLKPEKILARDYN